MKLFHKIASISLGLSLALGIGVVASRVGSGVTKKAEAASSSLVFSTTSGSSSNSVNTWTSTYLTITQAKGTGSTAPNSSYLAAPRWYSGNDITFTPNAGATITGLVITATSADYAQALSNSFNNKTADSATYSTTSPYTVTWSGSINSAYKIRMSAQSRLGNGSTVSITYTPSANPSVTVSPTSFTLFTTDASGKTITATPENIQSPTYSWTIQSGSDYVTLENTSSQTVTVKPRAAGSATVRVTCGGQTADCAVTVRAPNAGEDASNPYTVAQARAAITAGTGITGVYTKGVVYQVDSYNETYHSITYWISDNGTNTDPLEIYGGLGIDDTTNQFTSKDDIKVGDIVVVHGNMKKYGDVFEYEQNNRLISLNRIASYAFGGDLTKKAYYVGDSWDYSGLTLQAVYGDSTVRTLGNVSDFITAGDLEVEATPSAPALEVTSVTIEGLYGTELDDVAEKTITGITVETPRALQTVSLDGDMTKKAYLAGEAWDVDGLYLTLSFNKGADETIQLSTLTKDTDYIFDHDTAQLGDTSIEISGEYENIDFGKTVNGITVSAVPGVIEFGSNSGHYTLSATPDDFVDNLGHTVSASITTNGNVTNSGAYTTIGNGDGNSTLTIVINLGSTRRGVDSVSVSAQTTKQSGNLHTLVYADNDVNNVILDGTHAQSTDPISTGQSYVKINANSIYVRISSVSNGMKVHSISYTLGETVQEFETFTSLAINNSSTQEKQFKVGQTFSSAGLVLTATDNKGFTKNYVAGFTTDYDGHTFVNGDVGTGKTVTVSLTIGAVTKTVSYTIDVIIPPTYSLVSSQNDLYEGMKVVLVNSSNKTVTVGDYGSSQYGVGSATLDGETITDISDTVEFTVRIYGNMFALQYEGTHYVSYSGSSNNASQTDVLALDAAWTYSTTGDNIGLQSANVTGRYLEFNGTKVACYTHTQVSIRIYASSASTKTAELGAETFAHKYLHMRDYLGEVGQAGSNYCNDNEHGYYLLAKAAYNALSSQEKTEFAKLSEAKARYEAWATANNDAAPYDGNNTVVSKIHASNIAFRNITDDNKVMPIVIIVTSIISLTAVAGYFLLKKKHA